MKKKKLKALTPADIKSPRNGSKVAVYQIVETIRKLRKINPDISKIPLDVARKCAVKKR